MRLPVHVRLAFMFLCVRGLQVVPDVTAGPAPRSHGSPGPAPPAPRPSMSRLKATARDLPRRSLWDRIKDVALADVAVLARGGVSAGSLERVEEFYRLAGA